MSLTVYSDLEQRSPEWYAARCGIVTASAVGHLLVHEPASSLEVKCPECGVDAWLMCVSLARRKHELPTTLKKPHAGRVSGAAENPSVLAVAHNDTARALVSLLASERVTGYVEDTYTSHDMFRGIMAEPFARDLYSKHYEPADECGFMVRQFDGFRIGFSPDGLVGDDGLIEIKAPRQKTHLATVVADQVPLYHMAQLQTGLLVSGREWIDFVSFCGGMPLWVRRVTPDERWQTAILEAAEQAERAITETVTTYLSAVTGLPVTERIDFNLEVI